MTYTQSDRGGRDTLGVVGLGYVGLPLALTMVDAGYDVIGVDIDSERVGQIRRGESYINDVSDESLQTALDEGFEPTTEFETLANVVGLSICVPTPLRKTDTPDLSYVLDAVEQVAPVVPAHCTVVLESTVYPGATGDVVVPAFEATGRTVGEDLYVGFSPERIDPGNETFGPTDIPKVFGGITETCGNHIEALYGTIWENVVRVESATEAELVKLLENTFRAVNIGLINELAQIAHQLDVDIWEVIDAAATKPFGFMPFYPGPGLGGHCIPIDPMYLSWKATQQDIDTRFIELANTVNREMPGHVVGRVTTLLNDRNIPMPEASVLVLGVAYKPDVSDTRESAAYDVIGMLRERNSTVSYHDPFVPAFEVEDERFESQPLTSELLREHDCALVLTDHERIDVGLVVEEAPLVFDTRNATSGQRASHVVRL